MPNPGASQGPPFPIANYAAPYAQCPVDPITGAVTVGGVSYYTPLTTAGTTTIKATPGVYFGLLGIASGTSYAAVIYDIGTATNIIQGTATITAGQTVNLGGVGIRTTGAMVAVTSGTPGQINALWD